MNVLDLFFPKTCLECGREGGYICSNCLAKVEILKSVCPYCEKPSIDGVTHIKCQKVYGLDGLTSIWDYDGVVRRAITSLKYKYATEVGKELSNCFIAALKTQYTIYNILNTPVLVPIPIHWHRENVRGFNQSEEIGKLVTAEMGWGFNSDILVKKKSTSSQAQLSVEDRKKNLQGVFSVSPDHLTIQPFSHVILFDDVFTTGSTLKEAAKVLKHAGVKKIWGLTIAR